MDQASLNELLDELEHRTCVRFNSDPEMQEFINLVKELAPQRYFPHAGTWRLGTGTSSINGDATPSPSTLTRRPMWPRQ